LKFNADPAFLNERGQVMLIMLYSGMSLISWEKLKMKPVCANPNQRVQLPNRFVRSATFI
jgi:hypothetical protein